MDIIFAVTLSLFSVGMNSPEGKQIEEGLQMFRGGIKNRYAQQWYGGELPRNNPKYQETPIGRTETEKCNL